VAGFLLYLHETMMHKDIVERLLHEDDMGLGGCWPQDRPCSLVRREAAEEIKRLRALLKECADAYEETQYYEEDILNRVRRAIEK
jgi:hypothetical protein